MSEKSQVGNKRRTLFIIGILSLISLLIMFRQLATSGYFSCLIEDTWTYTSWAFQFIEALKEGTIYPRWAPLNFWGYGSPTFILYPPLAYYLTALLNAFTGSVIAAMNIAKYAALLLSGIGMFFLVREFYSDKVALLSAVFYMGFPFNVFGLYYYGTFASVVSLMWFSPIMLFAYKYIKKRQYEYILYSGVCYGGLILTHLINAYMFAIVIGSFVIYLCIIKKRPWDFLVFPGIILIGSCISAAYLFPLLYEKQFLSLKSFVAAGGGFDYSKFFIYPNRTGQMPSGNFWPVYYREFESTVFLLVICLCIFLIRMIKIRNISTENDTNIVNIYFFGAALGSLFLLFGVSSFLWNVIPFFKFIQFPFRWLNIVVYLVGFLFSSLCYWIMDSKGLKHNDRYTSKVIVGLLFLICALYDLKYIITSPVFTPDELMPPKSVNWTKEHLPTGVDINKIGMNETNEDRVTILKGEGNAEVAAWNSTDRSVKTALKEDSVIRIRTFYFPGWKAFIDGYRTIISKEDGTGAMLVDIPRGTHLLELKFVDTPIRFYSKLVTIISFLGATITFLAILFRRTIT